MLRLRRKLLSAAVLAVAGLAAGTVRDAECAGRGSHLALRTSQLAFPPAHIAPSTPSIDAARQVRTPAGSPTPFAFFPRRTPAPFDPDRLRAWVKLVNGHAPGAADVPASDAASWTTSELAAVVADLLIACDRLDKQEALEKKTLEAPSDRREAALREARAVRLPGWEGTCDDLAAILGLSDATAPRAEVVRVLERAALLHSDVGMLDARASRQTDVAVVLDVASVHLGVALALVNRLRGDKGDPAFARAWYVAVAVFLQSTRDIISGPLFVRHAVELFPDEPRLHFVGGVLNEFLASPWVQGAPGLKHDVRFSTFPFANERAYLEQAERYYRQTAFHDPASLEARLRAAHIAGRRGEHRRAMSELKAVEPELADARLHYFFWLFLGEEQKRGGNCAGASDSYQQALGLFPRAQAAEIALSHARRQCGDKRGAAEVLGQIMEGPAIDDPWDTYFDSGTRDLPARLRDLWQAARSRS
jgi:hypothetical protein